MVNEARLNDEENATCCSMGCTMAMDARVESERQRELIARELRRRAVVVAKSRLEACSPRL